MKRKLKKPTKAKKQSRTAKITLLPEQVHERIQQKAYELYKDRSYQNGNDWNDWFEAERIVMSEFKKSK